MIDFYGARGPHLRLDPSSVLDIGACVIDGVDLAPGRAIPDDGDARIDHSLEGFLFTCGPDHIRHPVPVANDAPGKRYPLHGSASSHTAEILSLEMAGGDADCHARIPVRNADGSSAMIWRRWHIEGASGVVTLEDRVENSGKTPFSPMLMYHMNIGAKHFDDGVRLEGDMLEGGGLPWAFGPGTGSVFCVPAKSGSDGFAEVSLGPIAAIGGRRLVVGFKAETLPFLQIWRNQADPAHVLGIEPVSHRLASREALAAEGALAMLTPGESRDYALRFSFV